MRGLTKVRDLASVRGRDRCPAGDRAQRRARPGKTAVITGGAVVALAAAGGLVLAGCGSGGEGLRQEGKADTAKLQTPSAPDSYSSGSAEDSGRASAKPPTPVPAKVNAVRLVKADPKVSTELKASLQPCDGSEYPVDVRYGALTGKSATDVVVTVRNCEDSSGIGSYVYRKQGGRYENVFTDEQGPLFADIDPEGKLIVTRIVFTSDAGGPAGQDETIYEWVPTREQFVETTTSHTDYGDSAENPSTGDDQDGGETADSGGTGESGDQTPAPAVDDGTEG